VFLGGGLGLWDRIYSLYSLKFFTLLVKNLESVILSSKGTQRITFVTKKSVDIFLLNAFINPPEPCGELLLKPLLLKPLLGVFFQQF